MGQPPRRFASCATRRGAERQSGLAYIAMLMLVAVIGIMLGAAADVWVTTRQRQKEAELLWVGNKYREAILSYAGSSPGGVPRYPARLEDLLLDNRSLATRRHLRRIYVDPMTGKADWELLMAPQGGIAGVRSTAPGTPLKQKGFRPRDALFEDKTSYADWQFSALPPAPPNAPGGAQIPGAAQPAPGAAPPPGTR